MRYTPITPGPPPVGGSGGIGPASTTEQRDQGQDMGVLDYAKDVAWNGVAGGAVDAVNETLDFGYSVVDWMDNTSGLNAIEEENPFRLPEIEETETIAGDVTRGVSQFLTGFVGAGKFIKGAKWASKLANSGWKGRFALSSIQGAAADAIVFDPHEERLSNLIETWPALANPVTDFLAEDDDDTEAMGRFKNALEGLALGTLTEPLAHAIGGLKRAKRVGAELGEDAADEVIHQTARDIDPILPKEDIRDYKVGDLENLDTGVSFTPEEVEGFQAAVLDAASKGQPLEKVKPPKSMFNMDRMGSADSVKAGIHQMGELLKPMWDRVEKHYDLKIEAQDLADTYGTDWQSMLQHLAGATENVKEAKRLLIATKMTNQAFMDNALDLSSKINHSFDERTGAALLKNMEIMGHMELMAKNLQQEFARAVSAGRIQTMGDIRGVDRDAITQAIEAAGGEQAVRKFAANLSTLDNPKAVFKVARKSKFGKALDIHNEYWINSILSGVRTQVVNLTSNAVHTTIKPAEMALGAAISGDKASLARSGRLYVGLAKSFNDSLKMAYKALQAGESFLDPMHGTIDIPRHQISAQNFGKSDSSVIGQAINWAGKVINIPSRFLITGDEFFKQINYRANVHADLYEQALKRDIGAGLSGKQKADAIAGWMEKQAEKFFDAQGGAVSKRGTNYMREVTFTKDLEYGISRDIQQLANRNPWMRPIIPFVRTPSNILRQTWQRTPGFNYFQRQLREELQAGGEVAAMAKGKIAMGGMLWGTASVMALSGQITGGGPKEYHARKEWRRNHQPYSVKVGDKWYSYARMDPWGIFFGLAADFTEVAGHMKDEEAQNIGGMMVAALSRNLGNKSYLTGLTNALMAFNDPDRYGSSLITNQLSTYIPFSSALKQFRTTKDPLLRETRTLLDAVMNKIPGYSEKLPPKRDWLTGDPISYDPALGPDFASPFFSADYSNDSPVFKELERLGHTFSGPDKDMAGVELTSEQLSEYNRLIGKTKIRGSTLLQSLERVIQSPEYDIDRERYPDAKASYEDADRRVMMLERIIRGYRKMAKVKLFQQFPELRSAYTQHRYNKAWAKAGRSDKIQEIIND